MSLAKFRKVSKGPIPIKPVDPKDTKDEKKK